MKVELRYFDGCPNWKLAEERLLIALSRTGHGDVRVLRTNVETAEHAADLGCADSPTVMVDGRDPLTHGNEDVAFVCRVYQTPEGLSGTPTIDQLSEAVS